MPSKHRLLLSVIASLAIVTISIPSESAPKVAPGLACKPLNKTVVVQNKTLTCIKKGKKQVWTVGVKTEGSPNKAPNPAAPTPTPSRQDEFAPYGKDAARFRAVDAYGVKLISLRKKDATNLLSILETPSDPAVINMTENAKFAFSVYEQFMQLGYSPKWIVGQSENWVKGEVREICPNLAANIQPNAGAASCRLTLVWRATGVSDDANTRQLMLAQGGHEIFHLYQQELWRNSWNVVPDWFREGSANLGMGIILTHFDNRKTFAEYGAAQKVERNPRDRNSCQGPLEGWEKNQAAQGFGYNNGCEYGLGLIMHEFLVLKGYTLKDTLDVVKLIGNGADFPSAFQQVYKISTVEYFPQFREHLKTLDYGW